MFILKAPLSMDRIMEGREFASQSPLFDLPCEILSMVMQQFDKIGDRKSLSQLALVNSDCLQLAHSCQWSYLVLQFTKRSHEVLGFLVEEAELRRGLSLKVSLRPRIRQRYSQLTRRTRGILQLLAKHPVL